MADEIKQTIVIEAQLTKIQSDLRQLENNFKGAFANIESAARSLGGALGIGLSVGSVVAFGKSILDLGDQLTDLRDQTGLTVQTLGGIKPILDSSNSSLEGFAKGFAKFQRSLGDFQGTGKQAAEALQAIKLDPSQLANASADQALQKIVGGLASVQNQNERAAIAFRLFGRSAAELIPTILQLAEHGIPKLDQATTEAFEKLGKLRDELTFAGGAFVNFAAGPIAEIVQSLFDVAASFKDVLTGFNALIEVFTGGASTLDIIVTIFKGWSYVLQGDAFALLALLDSLTKILRVAPLVAEALSFNKLDFNSKAFTRASEQIEQQMDKISERFLKQFQPKLVEPVIKPPKNQPFKGLLPGDAIKETNSAVNGFIASLEKEIVKVQEQNKAFFEGADAAKAFALNQDLLILKQKTLADLIAKGFSPAAAGKAVEEAFARVDIDGFIKKLQSARAEFLQLADKADKDPAFLQHVFDVRNADEQIDKVRSAMERLRQATAPAPSGVLADFDLKAINAELGKAQQDAQFFANALGDSFDKAGADVAALQAKLHKLRDELKLPADNPEVIKTKIELDEASVQQVQDELKKRIAEIQDQAKIAGPFEFNVPQETAQAERSAADKLINQRTPQAAAAAQALKPNIQADQVKAIFDDLNRDLTISQRESEALGGSIDVVSNNIDALTNAIKRLIAQGIDPLDPRIQDLKKQLDDQQAFKDMENAANDLFDVLDLNGQIKSWKDFGNAVKQTLDKIALDILRRNFQQSIQGLFNGQQAIGNRQQTPTGSPEREAAIKSLEIATNAEQNVTPAGIAAAARAAAPIEQAATSTASTSFAAAATQFAAAVAQFASAVGFNGLGPQSSSLGTVGSVTSASDALDQEFGKTVSGAAKLAGTDINDYFKSTVLPEMARQQNEFLRLGGHPATEGLDQLDKDFGDAIASVKDEAIGSISTAGDTAQSGIEETGKTAQSGISGLIQSALQTISAKIGGEAAGGSSLGSLSGFASLFSGGSSAAPAAASTPGIFSSFPASTAGALGEGFNAADLTYALAFHSGGIVGPGSGTPRSVDASVFRYAPRYHNGYLPGLNAGERPAILQDGETVLPRNMKWNGGGGGQVINVINPNFADRRSVGQKLAQIGAAVKAANRNL